MGVWDNLKKIGNKPVGETFEATVQGLIKGPFVLVGDVLGVTAKATGTVIAAPFKVVASAVKD
ncbi:MAG: hypothetical protein WCL30_05940, partial [Pseudomonadota bacterium]